MRCKDDKIVLSAIQKDNNEIQWINKKSQAHHPDYSKKLNIVWLCSEHHAQVHAERINLSKVITKDIWQKKYQTLMIVMT